MTATILNSQIAGQFFADSAVTGFKIDGFERGKTEAGHDYLRVKDVPIFRSGEFEDSMGERTAFDSFMIETIVRNFDYLKSAKIFDKPVVRSGHPSMFTNDRMKSVIGYIDDIRSENREAPHDHEEYTYVIADLLILDKESIPKIESGLLFNRSAEIGPYKDNRGQVVGPCMLGVAYVDIPAVEGLNFDSPNVNVEGRGLFYSKAKDDTMSGSGSILPPNMFTFKIGGNDTTDFSRVQGYISDLEGKYDKLTQDFAALESEKTLLDKKVADLTEFKKNQERKARVDFVEGLVKDNKILASAKDDTLALFETYSAEQFEAAKKVFSAAAPAPILEKHGEQHEGEKPDAGDEKDDKARKIADYQGIIQGLKYANKTDEQIKATSVYKELIALDPNFSL